MWIEHYPATLIDPPPEAWDFSDHKLLDPETGEWSVMLHLWTVEEGHSDLLLGDTSFEYGGDTLREDKIGGFTHGSIYPWR